MAPVLPSTDVEVEDDLELGASTLTKAELAAIRRRAREVCPVRPEDLKALKAALGKLTPRVSLDGWDESPPSFVGPCPADGVEGAWFDVDDVVKKVKALGALRHTKGRWAGRPLVPDAWQVVWIIAPVFGYKYAVDDPDEERAGYRIVREAYVEVPRKNGKSTISSGLALILLAADGEPGAEVYAAAGSRPQARIVFDAAKVMADHSPELRAKTERLRDVIRFPKYGSIFRALSADGEGNMGLNTSGAIVDELHTHKNRSLVDSLDTSTAARSQPLIVTITTADQGEEGTIYDEKHTRARQCAQRIYRLREFYGVVWCAGDDDDPFAESTMRKANPGFGRSVSRGYLVKEARKAKASPSYFPVYARLHLNRRIRQQARFLRMEDWDLEANAEPFALGDLAGAECYGGLDLSATSDFTAMQLVFPNDTHDRLRVVTKLWLPEADLDARMEKDRLPYDEWAAAGWITLTEGNVVDYDAVVAYIKRVARYYDLRGIRHDRWQAGAVVNKLSANGIDTSPVSQTYGGMSEPSKMLERLVKSGQLQHGAHPVLRWMADNTEIIRDKANPDMLRPIKPHRERTSKRIDGIVATIMAVDAWTRREVPTAPAATARSKDTTTDIYRPRERLGL